MTVWTPSLMFGPLAPEANPPINPQFYQPSVFNISAITNGMTTLVTTTVNHNYVIGQLVRLLISEVYNALQFNEQEAYVISIPNPNQVTLLLDSAKYNTFVADPTSGTTQPQIVAVGEINTGVNNTGRTEMGHSFQDHSLTSVLPE